MVDQQEQSGVAVRHSIVVEAPQDRAFTVFTQRMQSWWPMESHRIGGKPITDLVTEPHAGGRWYERAEDGSECDWGRVVAWEPPARVVLTWQVSHDWRPATGDPHGDRGPLHARGRRPHAGRPRAPWARGVRRAHGHDAQHLRLRAAAGAGCSSASPRRPAARADVPGHRHPPRAPRARGGLPGLHAPGPGGGRRAARADRVHDVARRAEHPAHRPLAVGVGGRLPRRPAAHHEPRAGAREEWSERPDDVLLLEEA